MSASSSSSSSMTVNPMQRALGATKLTSPDNLDVLHRLLQAFLTNAEVGAVRKTHPALARMGEVRTLHMKRGAAVYAALRAEYTRNDCIASQLIQRIFTRVFHRFGTHDMYALLGTSGLFGEAYGVDGRLVAHDILNNRAWITCLSFSKHALWHMPALVAKFKAVFQTTGKSYARLLLESLDFVDRLRADQLPHQLRANIPFDHLEPLMEGLRDKALSPSDHFSAQKHFTVCDVFLFALDTFANAAAAPVRFSAPTMATLEDLDAAHVLTEFWVLHPEHAPYAYAGVVQERHAAAAAAATAAAAAANNADAGMKDDDEAAAAVAVPRNHGESVNRPVPDNWKPNVHTDRTNPMDED
jgi:hypothetical protein